VRSFSAQVPVFEENGYFFLFSEKVIFLGNTKKAGYDSTLPFLYAASNLGSGVFSVLVLRL
jgi:hypothetical protein